MHPCEVQRRALLETRKHTRKKQTRLKEQLALQTRRGTLVSAMTTTVFGTYCDLLDAPLGEWAEQRALCRTRLDQFLLVRATEAQTRQETRNQLSELKTKVRALNNDIIRVAFAGTADEFKDS